MQQVQVRSQEKLLFPFHIFSVHMFSSEKKRVIPAIVSSGSLNSAFEMDDLISDRDPLGLLVFVPPLNLLNPASCLY
jgi:hypothetical protein